MHEESIYRHEVKLMITWLWREVLHVIIGVVIALALIVEFVKCKYMNVPYYYFFGM